MKSNEGRMTPVGIRFAVVWWLWMVIFSIGGQVIKGTVSLPSIVIHSITHGFGAYWLGMWFSHSQRKKQQ